MNIILKEENAMLKVNILCNICFFFIRVQLDGYANELFFTTSCLKTKASRVEGTIKMKDTVVLSSRQLFLRNV